MLRAALANTAISRTRRWPAWARYAATLAIVVAIFLLRRAADPILPQGYPYLLAFLAVLLSAALFDHAAGLLAAALSAALAAYFYLPPLGSLAVERQGDVVGLAVFAAVAAAISLTVETLHRALADLHRALDERQRALDDLARSNADLARSEERRGLLLREFRHRTRNDLHSLVGLLRLRARAAPSDAARDGLREAAEHALALARVHTHLAGDGRQDDAASVDTRAFVAGLCADLAAAQTGEGLRPVALVAEAEAHPLDSERAVQLGLTLNEAVTNALKYAFPEERAGTVRVRFAREGGEFVLTVADDGIGLPRDGEVAGGAVPPQRSASGGGLGTRLLAALAAQLRGTFKRLPGEGGVGTVAELRFPVQTPGLPPTP
jgi:two-component system, sensor histidine kinase PdtaS